MEAFFKGVPEKLKVHEAHETFKKIALNKTGNIFAPQSYPDQSGSVWPLPTVASCFF